MTNVRCIYCGSQVPEDQPSCPKCHAPSHFQQLGLRFGARRQFVILFVLFALAVLAMALWLPR